MKHLINIVDLIRGGTIGLIDETSRLREVIRGREVKKLPTLRGRTICNLLYENSIRTRSSLGTAGKWMSVDIINISASSPSVKRGEGLKDTALVLDAIGGDAIVARRPSLGTAQLTAEWTEESGGGPSIINVGGGKYQHPMQTLLDAVTLRRRLGGVGGCKVVIVGDILHSRVARSNIDSLGKLGAEVVFVTSPALLPLGIETWPIRVAYCIENKICDADAITTLRVQQGRMYSGFFSSRREYATRYGLSKAHEKMPRDDRIVMHPGPMPRDMGINDAVVGLPHTAVLQQVASGVHVRMTTLFALLTSGVSINLEGQA